MTAVKYHLGPTYLDRRAKTLWSWSQTGHLCDVTLKVGAVSLTAHRVVLAPVSHYFQSKFSGHFDANDKVMTFVDLSEDVERVTELELVLQAIYIGELTLDEDSISGVLFLASFLMIDCILEVCQMYLEEHLTLATCLDFYLMAETYNLPSIFQMTTTILQSRLHDHFIPGDELLQVSVEGLWSIFQNNLHQHCLPDQIVEFLVQWTKANEANSSQDGRVLELFSEIIQAESEVRIHEMLAHLSAQSHKSSSLRESFEDVIRKELHSRQELPDSQDTQVEPDPSEQGDHQQSSSSQSQAFTSIETTAVDPISHTKECSVGHFESNLDSMDKTAPEEKKEGETAAGNAEDVCLGSTDQSSVQNSADFQVPSMSGSTALSQAPKRTLEPDPSEQGDHQQSSSSQSQAFTSIETTAVDPISHTKECSVGHFESNLDSMDKTAPEEKKEGETAAGNAEDACLGSTDQNSVQNSADFQVPSTSGSTALSQAPKRTLELDPSEQGDHQQSSSSQSQAFTSIETTAVDPISHTKECSVGHFESNLDSMDKTAPEEKKESETAAGNAEDACLGSTDQNSVQNSADFQVPSTSGSTALSQAPKRTLALSYTSSNAVGAESSVEPAAGEPSAKKRCLSASGTPDEEVALEVLIVIAPSRKVVQSNCKSNRNYLPMEIVMYSPRHRKWSSVGRVTFPISLDEKSCWRMTSIGEDLYFISPYDELGHKLSLRSRKWTVFDMDGVFEGLRQVYTVLPLNVNGQLYVLASNRLISADDGYLTEHKYFRLERDWSWKEVGEVSHHHSQQPLSIISVSGSRVFTLKADIPAPVFRDHLILQESHILDTATGGIEKFAETCLVHSPVRMLIQKGEVYLVEGDKMMLKFDQSQRKWSNPRSVPLMDLRWCRKHAAESRFPCQGHAATTAGHSFFEMHGFLDNTSSLLEIAVDEAGRLETITHVPPPCSYFTLISTGKVNPQFFASLQQCTYLHP